MKGPLAVFGALAAVAGLPTLSSGAAVAPVQKVMQLLGSLLEKAKAEKHAEQVQYASFKQFVDDTTVEKTRAINEADERIGVLEADIAKNLAEAEQLTREIAVHDEDISVWNGDASAAKTVRDTEKEDHDATHKDYSESIDALGRAIEVVKKGNQDKQSLLQVSALSELPLVPADAKRMIDAFIEQGAIATTPPAALGYESHSHGIVEMFNELLNKFTSERTELEKNEMSSKHHYELLVQDLTAQLGEATKDRTQKTALKAQRLEAKAVEEAELNDVTSTRDADQTYLVGLTAVGTQKAADFASRQALRAEEIAAVEKAIEILASQAVAGNADKHLPKLLQVSAFVQLRAGAGDGQLRVRLREFLRGKAAKLQSTALSLLASRVSDDPFVKVRKMIEDLLARLQEEAGAEAEHQGWCDGELSTNEQTRNEKTASVEALHAQVDELDASIAKLANDVAENSAAVAELDAATKEATELRQQEKATNTETIADAQAAQQAVAQATAVLKEFYAKAGTATVFAQQTQQPEIPEIFSSAYTGLQSENGGVVGMLEVIQTDFARLESDTRSAETTAQKAYDTFMADSKADKDARTADNESLEAKKQDQNQALIVTRKDLEGTQAELEAALAYFDKLKPSCIDSGVTYEDRVGRRKEELESLQEALKILNSKE